MKLPHYAPHCAAALFAFFSLSTSAGAHEAWLLTPSEIAELASAPMPELFRSQLWLGLSALLAFSASLVALRLEPLVNRIEERYLSNISITLEDIGPLLVRLGLSSMLLLAAFGGLPRHGTEAWTISTFLVPDMQLLGSYSADLLIAVQIVTGVFLLIGLLTRVFGIVMVLLALFGTLYFGNPFLSYCLHFAAPGLFLIVTGGGSISLDRFIDTDFGAHISDEIRAVLWRIAQIMIGIGFIYLGIAYKLLQPTLLIAILEHGGMPTFGLPMPVIAMVMTGVEIICGAFLVMGRLVRPVSLAILGAITFLAVILGETPFFHANLYGALALLFIAGRPVPKAVEARVQLQEKGANG